ncbi:MAG TPA: NosD domain-containing protein [Aggregatilineaceae bacterium]|nr:NosD domain-containing protein [Aggregatilineaceae bacterium]
MKTIIPTDGLEIREDIRLEPGVYHLPRGLRIAADGVTLDASGATLIGDEEQGVAVHVAGQRGVTVKGLTALRYRYGIRADDCQDLTLTGNRITRTAELEPFKYFLYLWKPVEEAYGGAILLNRVQGGLVADNDFQHQQNGVLLYHSSGLTVRDNNASFNSGWGVYLSASHDNRIERNVLDFCNRVYRRESGVERVEADAAGLVMVRGSSRNQVLKNACRGGGDGMFITGYEHPGVIEPCNDNLFEDNDCSYSPNNAIESTFSQNNIFRRNICSKSNYGFWLGFSWDNLVEDNIIEDNFIAGVAAEHAHTITFRGNQVRRNREGIRLWTRGIAVLEYWPGYEVSYDFEIEDNLFEENWLGFNGYTGKVTVDAQCHGYHLRGNTFTGNRIGLRLAQIHDCTVQGNTFKEHAVAALQIEDAERIALEANTFEDNAADTQTR